MVLDDSSMITIPALASLSIGQRIAAGVITFALWLAPAGATWLYMRGELSAQYALGKVDCEKSTIEAMNAANADAINAWKVAQLDVVAQSKIDSAKIERALSANIAKMDSVLKGYSNYVESHPLPAGCVGDADRVRMFNKARGKD